MNKGGILVRKDLEILQQAMLHEVEGATFYRLAAEKAEDEEIKENFLTLAEEDRKSVV